VGSELAKELARTFVHATFTNEERHVRRLAKVRALEERYERDGGRETERPAGEGGPGSPETLP